MNTDAIQFGFVIDALFAVRRMLEEYKDKSKQLYMYIVDIEKACGRVPRKVM